MTSPDLYPDFVATLPGFTITENLAKVVST
jgi:hypothetical protein